MSRVGIPRALLYYQYYPLWKAFLEALGADVIVSSPTTRATVSAGSARVVADTCLPVKVFCGHVLSLCGVADWILVPAVRSAQLTGASCAKLAGLPDLVRAVVPEAPPLLDPEIDLDQAALGREGEPDEGAEGLPIRARLALYGAILRVGSWFTLAPKQIRYATERAQAAHAAFVSCLRAGCTPAEAIEQLENREGYGRAVTVERGRSGYTIGVLGHPYNLYDGYANHRVLDRLRALGVRVLTPEMLALAAEAGDEPPGGGPYWMYEDRIIGAAEACVRRGDVDGMIAVSAFGCAPDSTLLDVVQRAARAAGCPFMSLVTDEHTGEAGMVTRLEAFVDMIARRRRREER